MEIRVVDEVDGSFGWLVRETLGRTSHALASGGRVWLVDPVDAPGVEERVRALGEPAGVLQLLDRHARDCVAWASRLGVPHHVVPFGPVPGVPFEFLPVVDRRVWRETALWWPERRLLACGDALGTIGYFRSRREAIGVHPLLRLRPPRWLAALEPEHVLCGHGEGVHGPGTAEALADALAHARRRLPAALLGAVRRVRR
ncbi:MAG TPA: hypothetical protein VM290_06650 [Gaiellaceae bacterium]|nr:hypothetical protein [Gaiellaceae bacterium]